MSLKQTNRLSLPPLLKSVLTLFPLLPSTKIFPDTNQYISSESSTKSLFLPGLDRRGGFRFFSEVQLNINTELPAQKVFNNNINNIGTRAAHKQCMLLICASSFHFILFDREKKQTIFVLPLPLNKALHKGGVNYSELRDSSPGQSAGFLAPAG